LFPNHKSTLQITDPELIGIFDNFAFDEVISYGNLDTRTRLMMILASTIAGQALCEYKVMLGGALNVGNDKKTQLSVMTQLLPYHLEANLIYQCQ
jgi:4-carboxymuconolactone decarboxylase